jgi:hypothetical protein
MTRTKAEFNRLCADEARLTRQLADTPPGRHRLDLRTAILELRNQIFDIRRQLIAEQEAA